MPSMKKVPPKPRLIVPQEHEKKRKKHKLKKQEAFPPILGSFDIVGCDLSMNCPGFALIHYNPVERSIKLIRKGINSNRANKSKRKTHGKILGEIGEMFSDYIKGNNVAIVVRERAFSRFNNEVQTLHKVCGVTEMLLYYVLHMPFQELTPTQVKMHVTGSGRATKEEVAEAISNYCKHTEFNTDNESDACAVAIAWLIANGYLDCKPLPQYAKPQKEVLNQNDESAAE